MERHWPPLLVVGLTGGIASGKSTVARMFGELGAVILNADAEGYDAVAPGAPALAEIVAHFGSGYLRPDGTLDRRALGERIFTSAPDRAALNRITHPRIAAQLSSKLDKLSRGRSGSRIVVLEAAILVEAGWDALVDKIIVVVTQPATQVSRLMTVLGLSASQAEARLHAQLPLHERLRHADYRVDGEAPLSQTRAQVHDIWTDLQRLSGGSGRNATGSAVPTE